MGLAEGKAAIDSLEVVAGWLRKANRYFQPFRPEIKGMTINYRTRATEINVLLNIPDGLRRRKPVEIPAYQGFTIVQMMDESFSKVTGAWRFETGKWKLDAAKLPKSEMFLVNLRGNIAQQTLTSLVRIQPAANRDQTTDLDRFWLDCMLRNAKLLEDIYKELNIDEIAINVKVDIQRTFSSTIPFDFKRRIDATKRWISAGKGRDREEINRAWLAMRSAKSGSSISADELISMVLRLTTGEQFADFLMIDHPYNLGHIRPEKFLGPFPSRMGVDATTELGLNRQTATGYLSFKKRDFAEEVRKCLG